MELVPVGPRKWGEGEVQCKHQGNSLNQGRSSFLLANQDKRSKKRFTLPKAPYYLTGTSGIGRKV